MIVKGLIFDVNGTLVDIRTDEGLEDVYRIVSNVLSYQGIALDPARLRDTFFRKMKEQRDASQQRHPEFNVVEIFQDIISLYSSDFSRRLPKQKLEHLPLYLAETYRAASRFRLELYPGVMDTIAQLHQTYQLAVITDAQTPYAVPELHAVGLLRYFDPIIVSGDVGFRKPHQQLFRNVLSAINLKSSEVLYVGNDMYRDVYGAQRVGIKTVFIRSNQGLQEKEGVNPDYIIYNFPELLNAVRFFEGQ
ncbi:HAD family hydrolase [Nitrospira sp. KM1]|uniref:HAD family hydrolase n=1 Tax=Nitrospira sp. KM1 TaxID=1936990 RepID=UPI0013A72CD7|nr:HAD family hydrolase [Nitrospira sp. KM1]BCA55361.1 HAD family hydrolase [Nitrospira sp. KM1]